MASFDIEAMLAPVDPDHPCGPSMVYDSAYVEIERLAKGTPEQQIGDTIRPAEEPDWRDLLKRCTKLLSQTRDLRLETLACVAGLVNNGWEGLADGLSLLRRTLEHHWDHVHPQLDPDDKNDPTERLATLQCLFTPLGTYGDPVKFIAKLHECPLTESRQLGRFSLRDIGIATGDERFRADPDAEAPQKSTIDGAFEDTPPEALKATEQAVVRAGEEAQQLVAILSSKVGAERAPDAQPLVAALNEAVTVVREQMARRGLGVPAGDAAAGPAEASASGGGGAAPSGEIRSREDVRLALDRLCRYYDNHEPSSPVPLLLRGAKRLVSANYVEIAEFLSPDALKTLSNLVKEGDGA